MSQRLAALSAAEYGVSVSKATAVEKFPSGPLSNSQWPQRGTAASLASVTNPAQRTRRVTAAATRGITKFFNNNTIRTTIQLPFTFQSPTPRVTLFVSFWININRQ